MTDMHSILQPLAGAKEIIRLSIFFVFVVLGVLIWHAPPAGRSRAILRLVVFVVGMSCLVGFTQVESWPFTTWALVHGMSPKRMTRWELMGIDRRGRAYEIDPRVIQPMAMEEFDTWMRHSFFQIDPAGQKSVAEWILKRAEEGRQRFLKSGAAGSDGWLFGLLAAPHHFTRGRVWNTARDVPPDAFASLQIWLSEWDVEERSENERRTTRRVIYALP